MSANRRRRPRERVNSSGGAGMRAITGLLMLVLCVATGFNTVRINELRNAVVSLQKENEAWRALVLAVRGDVEEGERALPTGTRSEPARQKLRRAQERINEHLKTYPAPVFADGATATPPPERK